MNKIVRKVATVGVSVATVVSLAGVGALAPVAGADTISDLQAQIAALTAQLNALAGGGGGACFSFTRSLTVGSQGADVTALQDYLTGTGHFTFSGGSTGYFGSITASAVASWQAANGVAPAVGYFGPLSQAKYMTMCGGTTSGGTTGGTSALMGGAGSIADADFISSLNNEEVGEGQDDVGVAGLEIEADDGSDIELTAVRLVFVHGGGAGESNNFDRYADEVSVTLDGEEVARVDADEFSESPQGTWSRTLSLDAGAIIRMGKVGDLQVDISAVGNIDSDDEGADWTVEFDSVRFRDAQGATISDTATGDVGATRDFSFESFTTANNTALKVSLGDADINDAHVVEVSTTARTSNVPVLSFKVKIEGDSDVWLDELVVDFTTDEDDLNDVISQASLLLDGTVLGTESVTSEDATDVPVTFDNLDTWLSPGWNDFQVNVRFEAIDASFVEGTTLLAEITDTETDDWITEDETGNDLADADKTGSAAGEAHGAFSEGIMVELVSTSKAKTLDGAGASTPVDDQASFTFVVKITAFGADIYIPHDGDDTALDVGDAFSFGYTVTDGTLTTTAAQTLDSNGADGTSAWKVEEGTTDTFTLTVNLTATTGTADFASVALNGIGWGTTDITTSTNDYAFNLDDFKTGSVFMTAQ